MSLPLILYSWGRTMPLTFTIVTYHTPAPHLSCSHATAAPPSSRADKG